jgi:hypothetical protein
MLVGTCNSERLTNLAIITSHLHLGSNPPLLALILRPSSGRSERHTLANILENGSWTLNSFTLAESAMAHQTSAPTREMNRNLIPVAFQSNGKKVLPLRLLRALHCRLAVSFESIILWILTALIC